MKILVVNAGSSSVKLSMFELDRPGKAGELPRGVLWERETDVGEPVADLLETLWAGADRILSGPEEIQLVGHRVVFGGATLTQPVCITPPVHEAIARAAEFAPAHNAAALEGIDAVTRALREGTPQVAVFDTAFHATLAPAAYAYAGPFAWLEQGIRRFGFHGISHEYASHRAARLLRREPHALRVVTCHLGSGCSLAAVDGGRSVDTTMGFTPLDGIPMRRRPGALDPGILVHLLRHGGYTVDGLDDLLNHDSGLAGLSGTDGDMRTILAARSAGDARARLAFDVFVRHVRQGIAAMTASLGRVDALVFTGGVGENSAEVRGAVCEGLEFLGVALDATRNTSAGTDAVVSRADSVTAALVVHARENWMVACEALRTWRGVAGAGTGAARVAG